MPSSNLLALGEEWRSTGGISTSFIGVYYSGLPCYWEGGRAGGWISVPVCSDVIEDYPIDGVEG